MKKSFLMVLSLFLSWGATAQNNPRVTYKDGTVEGIDSSGVKIFRGIPFAQSPVGDLRWRAPQPVKPWQGIRPAKEFGSDPVQHNIFGDMVFEAKEQSEDCLYLNVWTPAKTMDEKLPVLIYFNGGGLVSGSGSEPRYQGLRLARRGIIVVTANYREGIFGFFSLPELTREGCSGNQGWLDQVAATKWVKTNIAAFGGDPNRITINGESAGAQSTCALSVSPLSRGWINGVMCSSGAVVANAAPVTLKESETVAVAWAKKNGLKKLADMRRLSAAELERLNDGKFGEGTKCIDGTFLTEDPTLTLMKGEQAQVPMLLGNNDCELPVAIFAGGKKVTKENLAPAVSGYFGTDAGNIYDLYGIKTDADLQAKPGYVLGGDMFIAYATWKWADLVRQTSRKPVYRYVYCHPRPSMQLKGKAPGLAGGTVDVKDDAPAQPAAPGAMHATDIEYAMGNLSTNPAFAWQADDYATSEIFQQIYVNFVKYGNPNGLGLPQWDTYNNNGEVPPVMLINTKSGQKRLPEAEARYHRIDELVQAHAKKDRI